MTKRNTLIIAIITLLALLGTALVAQPAFAAKCGGAQTSIIECDGEGEDAIFGIISMVIRVLTGAIGLVAVGAVIYGAVLYGMSGDSPENVKKAKEVWMNVVIGLLLFAFMVAITNFLIPGGVW